MTVAISLFNVATPRATLRSVLRVNLDYFKAEISRFVLQELFKLVEGPLIGFAVLRLAARGVADTIKLFNRNRRVARCFGKVNQALGDDVVYISHKTRLFSAQPFQSTPNRARVLRCLFLLKGSTSVQVAVTDMTNPLAAKELRALTVRGDGQIVDTTIYADDGIVWLTDRLYRTSERHGEKNFTLADEHAPVAESPVLQVTWQHGRTMKRYTFYPSVKRPNAQAIGTKTEVTPTFATLQRNSVVRLEVDRALQFGLGSLGGLVFGRNLADCTNGDLCRQTEQSAHVAVDKFLHLDFIGRKLDVVKANLTDVVASFVPSLDRALGCISA